MDPSARASKALFVDWLSLKSNAGGQKAASSVLEARPEGLQVACSSPSKELQLTHFNLTSISRSASSSINCEMNLGMLRITYFSLLQLTASCVNVEWKALYCLV